MLWNTFGIITHPTFSPDFAPSDFYLFGKIKNRTQGAHFKDGEDLINAIKDDFEKIQQ